jgi:16S rRNA processing protein RimM
LPDRLIQLGVIGRAHGVRGQVRVTSFTEEPADLTRYGPLTDESGRRFVLRLVGENIAEISEVVGEQRVKVADRAAAERLTNTKLFIERDRLPVPDEDEYYLADLIGLTALGANGARLGCVSAVHDYGGGASLEIAGESGPIIVPFTAACVPEVDIAAGHVVVVPPEEIDGAETKAADGPDMNDATPPARHPRACLIAHPGGRLTGHPRTRRGDLSPRGAGTDPGDGIGDDGDEGKALAVAVIRNEAAA